MRQPTSNFCDNQDLTVKGSLCEREGGFSPDVLKIKVSGVISLNIVGKDVFQGDLNE